MRYRHCIAFATVLAFLICPVNAFADDDHQRMLELSDIATDAVADGQFEVGAVQFREAYETYPDPILLNNEMIAWFQAEDCDNALRAANHYLETDEVEPEDLPTVKTVQRNCHLQLAATAAEEQNPHLAAFHLEQLEDFELEEEEEKEKYDELRQAVDESTPLSEDHDDVDVDSESSRIQSMAWAPISGGIAVAGVGFALHAVALDRQSQLRTMADSQDPQDALRFQDKQQQWGSYQRTTRWAVPTLYAVGALSIGSGIFLMTRDQSSSQSVSVAPSASSEGMGVSFSGQF